MNIFAKDNDMAERLEASNAENDELQGLVAQREDEIKGLSEKVAELSAGIEAQAAELEESKAANANLEAVNSELVSQLNESQAAQEDFDSKVEAAACAKMAELGTPEPVEAIEDADESLVTRAQFNKMNPAERSEFALAGGRIKRD